MAVTRATTKPVTNNPAPSRSICAAFLSKSYPEAASMVGIASKKEYSAATPRESPSTLPPMIVAAEREVPGIIARAWKRPTWNALAAGISSSAFNCPAGSNFSRIMMATPPATRATETTQGLNRTPLMKSCPAKPITAAGRNPTRSRSSKCLLVGEKGSSPSSSSRSL